MWRRARTPEQVKDIQCRTSSEAELAHKRSLVKIGRSLDRFGFDDVDMVTYEQDLYLPQRPDSLYCQPDIIVWGRERTSVIEYKRSWKHYPTALLQLGHAAYVLNRIVGVNPDLYFIWEETPRPQRFGTVQVSLGQVAQIFGQGWEYRNKNGLPRCEHRSDLYC